MKRLLLILACILALTVSASAASAKAESMTVEMTVDENGTAKAEVEVRLTADAPVDQLDIVLGPNVSGVHVSDQTAHVSRAGGQTTVTLGGEEGLRFPMELRLSYTVRNTVDADSESQRFSVRLMGALKEADVEQFTARVQMPDAFEAIPEFSSGYYADGIDNYLSIDVKDGRITAVSMEPMLAGETLDLRVEMPPDYFALHNVAGRTLLADKIAMIVLALFGALYWWRALRSPLLRLEPQTRAPMGVEPGVAAMLTIDEQPDLTLMVLNWAANGYLRAARLRGGRLMLTRLIPMGNERSAYEQDVFNQLFSKKETVASGTGTWAAARKKADKAARAYWYGRIYAEKPGRPGLLRLCAILMCGFAALSCADRVIPSMTLRLILLAAATVAGLVWGAALQYGLYRLPMRRRRQPVIILALCLAAMIVVIRVSRAGGALVAALFFSVLVAAALLFGPRRSRSGVDLLSDLLGWRKYLRTLTPETAGQLLSADPQYYYRTLLFAEALGAGDRFSKAFEELELDECALFKSAPREAGKFLAFLRNVLANGRGEAIPRRRPAPKQSKPAEQRPDAPETDAPETAERRPDEPAPDTPAPDEGEEPESAETGGRVRHNNPQRHTEEYYDPE